MDTGKWNGVWIQEVEWCVDTAGSRIVYAYREVEWGGDTEKGIVRGHREVEWCGHRPEAEWCVDTGKWNDVCIQGSGMVWIQGSGMVWRYREGNRAWEQGT